MNDQPNDHSKDLQGPDAGPLPGEPGNPEDKAFDLASFMPGLKVYPTVSSSGSDNVYTCVATKGGSLVGISVTMVTAGSKEKPRLDLVTRYLEVPEGEASQFAKPGSTREYRIDGKLRKVFMLRKDEMPMCDARVSPWEARSHLEAGIKDQLVGHVWNTLVASGCAINCKDQDELKAVLFSRMDQLPDSPTLYWKDLEGQTAAQL